MHVFTWASMGVAHHDSEAYVRIMVVLGTCWDDELRCLLRVVFFGSSRAAPM